MPLPDSRNETATPASPVKSATINDLQDCIIGRRHGELTYPIPAYGGFALHSGSYTVNRDISFPGGAGSVTHSLHYLPVGTVITTVAWEYNRAGAGTVTLKLRRRPIGGGAAADVQSLADATGAAIETTTETYNHAIAVGFYYWLEFVADNIAHILFGAMLKAKK
jgi:hypothetical protein